MLLLVLFGLLSTIAQSIDHSTGCPDYPDKFALSSTDFKSILNDVDSYLTNIVSKNDIPGFIVTVVYDQTQLWSKGYGSSNYFNSSAGAPTADDLVRIASNSKVFTDLLLFYLRDNGIVNLDDPVTNYLTNFSMLTPYETTRPVTLRQLASHTSGLPRELPYPCSWNQLCFVVFCL